MIFLCKCLHYESYIHHIGRNSTTEPNTMIDFVLFMYIVLLMVRGAGGLSGTVFVYYVISLLALQLANYHTV